MSLEELKSRLDSSGSGSPATRWLGLRLVDAEEGRTVVEMICRDEMLNFQGVVHGGFITALADSAMGTAISSVMPEGTRQVSFDLKMTLISAARPGDVLRASGSVIHAGRRTAIAESRVEGPDGRLVATSTGSFAVYRPREDG